MIAIIMFTVSIDTFIFLYGGNKLIVDWIKHCQKIDDTHRLDRDDPSDNKIYFKQEIAYIRFLINHGCDYDQCKDKWLQLENGIAAQFRHDKE